MRLNSLGKSTLGAKSEQKGVRDRDDASDGEFESASGAKQEQRGEDRDDASK